MSKRFLVWALLVAGLWATPAFAQSIPQMVGTTTITGTANEITASAPAGPVTISLPAALTFTGKTVTGGTFSGPTLSGTVVGTYTIGGTPTVAAGTGTATGTLCTVLDSNASSVGNVGGGTDDLMTYTLPANTLATNEDFLEITAMLTSAANANVKTVSFVFGATSTELDAAARNNLPYTADIRVIRTSATAQEGWINFRIGGTNATSRFTPTETLSGAVTIKFTGVGTDNDDIVQRAMTVKWCKAP